MSADSFISFIRLDTKTERIELHELIGVWQYDNAPETLHQLFSVYNAPEPQTKFICKNAVVSSPLF